MYQKLKVQYYNINYNNPVSNHVKTIGNNNR